MKTIGLLLTMLFFTGLKADAQWSAVDSGTTSSLRRTTNGGQVRGLELVAANSVKGDFAIDLPLTDAPGIECRSGGSKGNFTVNFIFSNRLTSVDNVTASCGNVSSFAIYSSDPHQLRVRLTGVTCNAQFVTLTVAGAHDDQGNSLPSVDAELGLLLGDVDGDGIVNNADGNQIKADRGQTTDSSNFREDINTNGRIDAGDLAIVKAQRGTMLPPPASPAMFVADKDDNSVIRANMDGSDAIDLGNIGGLLQNPTAIAVNSAAGKLYVVNGSGNSVVMSNLDGSNPVNLTFGGLLQAPYGIALDAAGGKVYVSVDVGVSPVIRANLDGSGAEGLGNFGGPFSGVELAGMDIDTTHGKFYVAANSGPEGQIARIVEADLADGANAVALDFGGSFYAPLDVKVDVAGNYLYVVDFSSLIYRSDLNGNGAVNLGVVAGPFPSFLALDLVGGKMYISAFHTVTQADLPDGANPVALNIPSLGTPAGIAIYRPGD
jgi:hypothetical protein